MRDKDFDQWHKRHRSIDRETARRVFDDARRIGRAQAERELTELLPGPYYMDPPNGGSVTVIEQVRRMAEDAAKWRAQQAAAPGALNLLNADELAALRRFDETCQDGEGYDVPMAMMQRLAAIGVVRRTSGSYYEQTSFGLHALRKETPCCDPAKRAAQLDKGRHEP